MYKINEQKREQAMDILSSTLGNSLFTRFETTERRIYPILEQITPTHPFHGTRHPLYDVMPSAVELGHMAKIDREEMALLALCAEGHDIGMSRRYDGHEEEGVRIMRPILKDFGFDPMQLKRAGRIVMATKMAYDSTNERMVQSPDLDDKLQLTLCAADFANLAEYQASGGLALHREWIMQPTMSYSPLIMVSDFFEFQRRFQEDHMDNYIPEAEELFAEGKQRNLKFLEARVRDLRDYPNLDQKFGKFLARDEAGNWDIPFEEAWDRLGI